jgi:CRP/FNR family transcriptional regulator, cyclic AMP receptor protein
MVPIEDIKAITLLEQLSNGLKEHLSSITELQSFKEREVIFEEGDRAENFYILKKGKVLLEVAVSESIIISLGSIKTGYSFGWSSLIPGSSHTSYAVCSEPCDVLIIPGKQFLGLLDGDHPSGYRFMTEVMKILKNRLDRRTGQFLKVMTKHPDIQRLLGL